MRAGLQSNEASALATTWVVSSAGTAQPETIAIVAAIHGDIRRELCAMEFPDRSRGLELTASNSSSVIMLHLACRTSKHTSSLPHVELVSANPSICGEGRHGGADLSCCVPSARGIDALLLTMIAIRCMTHSPEAATPFLPIPYCHRPHAFVAARRQ